MADRDFACETDAGRALQSLIASAEGKGFHAFGEVRRQETPLRGRGRPKKDAKAKVSVAWKALVEIGTVREEIHKRTCRRESTFILVPRLEKRDKALRRGGQKLPRPTAKTILEYLQPITLIRLGDQSRVGNSGENADAIIEALGFDWSLYTQGDCEDRFIRSKSSSGST